MRFKATEEQLTKIVLNAVNASAPVGLGRLQYTPGDLTAKDLNIEFTKLSFLSFDYVQGRMVKLHIKKVEHEWELPDDDFFPPNPEYQSWAAIYPTYQALLRSAGVKSDNIRDLNT